MCGILVIFSKKKKLNRAKCLKSLKKLYSRGPDHTKFQFLHNQKLFIANTVLSITGNPPKSRKLFCSKNRRNYISFNGEIYNYNELKNKNFSFLKKNVTDTEVLVNLYQKFSHTSIPEKLNGMFAYVIFDKLKKKLIIVNDVQGEKNLYYFEDNEYYIVSSTIKSILSFIQKPKLNLITLKNYFYTRHFMPINMTPFKKIKLYDNGISMTYSLRNFKKKKYIYDNPINWISKAQHNYFNKLSEKEIIKYFEKELIKQAKLMIPKIRFGSIFSGGIDSGLQTAILSSIKKPNYLLSINHLKKDRIMEKYKKKFEKYLKQKINLFVINKQIYKEKALMAYNIISSPMQTHDLPSRILLSEKFKKNNCKVFFSADGCDELFGGQQIYRKIFKKNFDLNQNISPYSSINNFKGTNFFKNKKFKNNIEPKLKKKWKQVFLKYNFLNKKERNIQSSLFFDYFMQSINVANRSNDLICCNYGIEPRNVFIQKNILKIIVNIPLKYKFRIKKTFNIFSQKFILKNIYQKYFNQGLIFKKEGFSGFPNSLRQKVEINNFQTTKKVLDMNLKLNNNLKPDLEWKLINMEIFLKENEKN